jgi:hypothetical protein
MEQNGIIPLLLKGIGIKGKPTWSEAIIQTGVTE